MTRPATLALSLSLTLCACALPAARPASVKPAPQPACELTAVPNVLVVGDKPAGAGGAFLAELSRVATLSPEQRHRELAGFDTERRLDDQKRFQLAALLEREDTADAWERGLKQLSAIDCQDAQVQTLIDLVRKTLRTRLETRQQNARVQELQDKIEQIKALEKSLQQRSVAPRMP